MFPRAGLDENEAELMEFLMSNASDAP